MGSLKGLFGIAYFVLGVVQVFATVAGLGEWLGIHWIVAFLIAVFVAYIPFVGTIAGIYGAVTAWGWPLVGALALFLGPYAVIGILMLGAGMLEVTSRRRT